MKLAEQLAKQLAEKSVKINRVDYFLEEFTRGLKTGDGNHISNNRLYCLPSGICSSEPRVTREEVAQLKAMGFVFGYSGSSPVIGLPGEAEHLLSKHPCRGYFGSVTPLED